MKQFSVLIIIFFLSFSFVSAQVTPLNEVISSQTDTLVRQKLTQFEKDGIEKTLNIKNLTPDELVNSAKKYLGLPHCMGGNGKTSKKSDGRKCIDCSGLLSASFWDAGVNTDIHSSQELARYGTIITDTSQIQKGDLLFFIMSYRSSRPEIVITHAAIAVDHNYMIHTSASNGVEITSINSKYWSSRFIFATRVF